MAAFTSGQAFFEVEVPQGASFTPVEYPVMVISGGGPQQQGTRTRQVSDPWPVDINWVFHFLDSKDES
jgi:hypothetical protein